jgi:hypothetical protein
MDTIIVKFIIERNVGYASVARDLYQCQCLDGKKQGTRKKPHAIDVALRHGI